MTKKYQIEISYYDKYNASILLQPQRLNAFEKLVIFTSYALRQIDNLEAFGDKLADVLACAGSQKKYLNFAQNIRSVQNLAIYAPLFGSLGYDLTELLRYSTVPEIVAGRNSSESSLEEAATELWPERVSLIEPNSASSEKSFLGKLTIKDKEALLWLDVEGFGAMYKDINWYASTSALLLFRYLYDGADAKLRSTLSKCAQDCGTLYRNTTSMGLIDLPVKIARQLISESTSEPKPAEKETIAPNRQESKSSKASKADTRAKNSSRMLQGERKLWVILIVLLCLLFLATCSAIVIFLYVFGDQILKLLS